MKTKDTGFIQQHIEKLVLGAGVLFLVAIAGYAFLGNPYAVEVGGEKLSPREAERRIVSQASQLEQRLRSDDGLEATISQREIPSYAGDFRDRIHRSIIETQRYAVALNMPGLDVSAFADREAPDPYYVPRPPVPDESIARASYGVLGEVEDRNVQEQLNRFVVDRQTRDFRAVSVSASFDLDQYARQFRASPPPGYQQLPENWWRAMSGISGIYLQREERDPVTGEWGDRQIIEPLPDQVAFGLEDEDKRWSVEEADYAMTEIRQNQRRIIQPQFVPMVGPMTWLPPDQARRQLSAEEQRELNRLNEQIQTLQDRIETWEERLRQMGLTPPSERGQRGRMMGPDGPSDFDGMWDQREEFDRPDPRDRRREIQRQRSRQRDAMPDEREMRRQQEQMEREMRQQERGRGRDRTAQQRDRTRDRGDEEPALVRQVEQQLERLRDFERQRDELYGITPDEDEDDRRRARGWDDGMNEWDMPEEFFPGDMPREFRQQARGPRQQRGRGERLSGEQQVWAHDLTAEPGRTYRYRVIVTVVNPLFQQRRLHPEQQEEYFNQIALWPDEEELHGAEASNWSEPVTLDPEHYFFLVDGSPSREEATVEVWRLYQGQWRSEEFDVRPGDVIGGEVIIDGRPVSMQVNSMLVDLVSVSEGTSSGRGARMIYLDGETNLIHERVAEEDRDSDDRIRLRNELDRMAELAGRSAER